MNIILFESSEISGDRLVALTDRRAEHIVKILRSNQGDRLIVGIINGKTGYGIIKEIRRKKPYRVDLEVTFDGYPNPPPPIDLLLALPRPIVFRRIISQISALGAKRVYVVNGSKVEKSYWEAGVITNQDWKDHMIEGLEQAVDTRLVDFSFHRGFKPFIQDTLPTIREKYRQMLAAHPYSTSQLAEVFRAGENPVLLAIGPEGGWNEFELEQMAAQGFEFFSMGFRILRVETAVTAVFSCVAMLQSMAK